jgi:DNA-binding ferritin-like protein
MSNLFALQIEQAKNDITDITEAQNNPAAQPIEYLVFTLLQSRLVGHIMHLRVNGPGAYPAHLALGEFYDLCSDYADAIAEQYQGKYMQLLNYPAQMNFPVPPLGQELDFVNGLLSIVEANILTFEQSDPVTSNILQDLAAKLRKVCYKLTFLK